jgi:hypothetical protein
VALQDPADLLAEVSLHLQNECAQFVRRCIGSVSEELFDVGKMQAEVLPEPMAPMMAMPV